MNAGFKIKRRDDLIPGCVALKFRVTNVVNGQPLVQVINDIAGNVPGYGVIEGIGVTGLLYTAATFAGGSPAYVGGSANSAEMQALQNAARDFAAVTATIDMEGYKESLTTCTISTVPVNTGTPASGGAALAFWKTVFPELADISSPDIFSGSAVTVVDDSGNPIDTSVFQYLLTRGQVAPWMLNGNVSGGAPAQSKKAAITAQFVGTENSNVLVSGAPTAVPVSHTQQHIKHATVTLLTIPGGTYVNQQVYPGEVVPYGLAGYIYNIESIPQYEGTFVIQETEITDLCPLGHNLNISGGLAEWAAMDACVQQISYDLAAGRTTLAFGPAGHLGAKDFVERLRVNRGPIRPLYGIGGNIQNSGSQNAAALGQDVSVLGPSPGPPARDLQIFPVSLSDLAAHSYAYGNPGVTVDTRGSGQPNYGNISGLGAPSTPTLHLQEGSGGTPGRCVRLSLSDLPSNAQAWFQPVSIYVDVSGVCTQKTIYVLCTAPA